MSLLKKNLSSNFVSKIWIAVSNFICIPIYVKILGHEAFGLIGLFLMLQSLQPLLDIGMSVTINREIARYSVSNKILDIRNMLRTFELLYWVLSITVGIIIFFMAETIIEHWINIERMDKATAVQAIKYMGCAMALRWPVSLYMGGFMGLEKQLIYNVINTIMWTLRTFGAVACLYIVSNSVLTYFVWHIIVNLLNVVVLMLVLWWIVGGITKSKWNSIYIKKVWSYTVGIALFTIIALLFNQTEKIMLSKIISVIEYGYYSLTVQIAGGLFFFYTPIHAAYFPVLTKCVVNNDYNGIISRYKQASILIAIAIIPIAVLIIVNPREILYLWTNDLIIRDSASEVLPIIMMGALIGALYYASITVVQAYGNVKILYLSHAIIYVIMVPTLVYIIPKYGMIGAATVLATSKMVQGIIQQLWMVKSKMLDFSTLINLKIVLIMLAVVFSVLKISRLFWNNSDNRIDILVYLSLSGIIAQIICIMLSEEFRSRLLTYIRAAIR
jgi:O-antigen/teichoic acid export membrane protein